MSVPGSTHSDVPRPGRFVLSLLESRRESPTSMTFRFSTKGTGFQYLSNQAIRLALPGVEDPWGAVRTFSLSSSPSEPGHISVTCKISDTPFKQALARLRPGETAEVYGPLGLFLYDPYRPAVFIAGGIGITPFRGMLRYAADTGVTESRRLLYSARVPEEFVFRGELDEMSRSSPHVQVHYTVTRPSESPTKWNGRVGRIDEAWIREIAGPLARPKFFVAGLPEMVEEMVTTLGGSLHVPEDDIDYEVFRGF
ncbi:MAG TPA: FAD-dependent oxidoreductase [Thermoplasmata archaeon]|nr:FAD-dependent oxidoreductase [Thermoplasmata archaeon]